jgi:hypothetical protein
MPRAGYEPATPATKFPLTYDLDRATTGIGKWYIGLQRTLTISFKGLLSIIALMMEAVRTSETSIRHYIPESCHILTILVSE